MAKRQRKISKDHINSIISGTVKATFILTNKSVYLAQALSLQSDILKIKNSKGHVLNLPLDQISEIWVEEKVLNS